MGGWSAPDFEASVLCVTSLSAAKTLGNILLLAFTGLVAHFIALETEFSVAHERIVLTATKNASQLFTIVGALPCHMAELFAPVALDCWVSV